MVLAMIMQRYRGAHIHVHKIVLTSSIDEGLMEGKRRKSLTTPQITLMSLILVELGVTTSTKEMITKFLDGLVITE